MFIVFEGLDGSGKTTQAKRLADFLTNLGKDVLLTREPGGTELGEQVRKILLQNDNLDVNTQLLLINAARVEHINKKIKPHLAKGGIVICDRFYLSTMIYQHIHGGASVSATQGLHDTFIQENPHITFFLDINEETLQQRLTAKQQNWLDCNALAIYRKHRQKIQDCINTVNCSKTKIIIDANKTVEEVYYDILHELIKAKIVSIKELMECVSGG